MGRNRVPELDDILATAVAETGSFCPGAVFYSLGKAFGVYIDESSLHAGMGMSLPGADNEALLANIGVCQFISVAARRKGLEKEVYLELCQGWKRRLEAMLPERKRDRDLIFLQVLELAYRYLREECPQLQLSTIGAKPGKYYDQIITDREAMFRHSPYALEEKLSAAVTRGDRERAVSALREITSQGDKAVLAKDPLRSAKNSMIGSIAFLSRAAIRAGVNADEAFALSDSLTQQVEDMTSRKAVLGYEENILLQFIDLVHARLENAYCVSVTRVMHYIENNLDKKITLKDAAAYAGVHPAYLSGRFKKETGQDFTGFVARRKIQESTYFIRHTHYSVSQIALLYGFSSQSYYITTFKRVLGITPMEYRARYLS